MRGRRRISIELQAWSPTERPCSCGRICASRGHSPLGATPSIAVKFSLDRHAEMSVGRTRHFLHFGVDFSGTPDGFSVIGGSLSIPVALNGLGRLDPTRTSLKVGSKVVDGQYTHGAAGLGTLNGSSLVPVFRDASRLQAPCTPSQVRPGSE